jgi:uncharacterized membrane protein YeaQ/YmgE (transglycosylase-associated protein family)
MHIHWFRFLIIGVDAGLLAAKLTRGRGFGIIGDLAVGILGAFFGGYIFRFFGSVVISF